MKVSFLWIAVVVVVLALFSLWWLAPREPSFKWRPEGSELRLGPLQLNGLRLNLDPVDGYTELLVETQGKVIDVIPYPRRLSLPLQPGTYTLRLRRLGLDVLHPDFRPGASVYYAQTDRKPEVSDESRYAEAGKAYEAANKRSEKPRRTLISKSLETGSPYYHIESLECHLEKNEMAYVVIPNHGVPERLELNGQPLERDDSAFTVLTLSQPSTLHQVVGGMEGPILPIYAYIHPVRND